MNKTFWAGKRVFVTGHTGFKGGWLTLWLQRLGAQVDGYSLSPPTEPNLFNLARLADTMRSVEGDVCDPADLQAAMAAEQPDIVFHLAAQSLVRRSYDTPVETYTSNVIGTVNVLEAVRTCPSVRAVVIVTSDKCYDNRGGHRAFPEDAPLGGTDPYSSSKACAEIVTAAYRRSFFAAEQAPAIATVRAGNVIGGGDWAEDRLIPDCIKAFQRGEAVRVRNPDASRPWQWVLEPLHGYLLLAERLAEGGKDFAEAWNFGPNDAPTPPTVKGVVETVAARWENGANWFVETDPNAPAEAFTLGLDNAKARTRLGWTPRLSLDEALAVTVDWYRQFAAGADMRGVTLEQIDWWLDRVAAGSGA